MRAATLSAVLFAAALSGDARAEDWGPWGGEWAPVEGVEAGPAPTQPSTGALARMWRWYRARSDRDGARCPYYPTCSAYGYTAVRRHGLALGGLYTLDRLLREYPQMGEFDHYPLITKYGTPRLVDPVPSVRERGD